MFLPVVTGNATLEAVKTTLTFEDLHQLSLGLELKQAVTEALSED